MRRTKGFQWLGWSIVMASVLAGYIIRHKGYSDTFCLNVVHFVMAMGAIITFVAFFIEKKSKS